MAKKSSIEKNNRRTRMAKQYAVKRAALKAMAVDNKLSPEDRFSARLKLAELPRRRAHQAGRVAAQFVADAHPQSLRAHGPSAGRLSQVQALAPCFARARVVGRPARRREVELVTGDRRP